MKSTDPFFDGHRHLAHLQDYVLLDIARNGSAQRDYRLLAVEILQDRKSEKLKHPDIQELVQELEIELEGIVFEHPAPGPGALKAGVTTRTLYGTPEQQFTGFDIDVPPTEPETIPTKSNSKEPDAAQP